MDEQKANFQYLGKIDRQNWSRYFTHALHTLILWYSKHVMDLRRRIPTNMFEKSECPSSRCVSTPLIIRQPNVSVFSPDRRRSSMVEKDGDATRRARSWAKFENAARLHSRHVVIGRRSVSRPRNGFFESLEILISTPFFFLLCSFVLCFHRRNRPDWPRLRLPLFRGNHSKAESSTNVGESLVGQALLRDTATGTPPPAVEIGGDRCCQRWRRSERRARLWEREQHLFVRSLSSSASVSRLTTTAQQIFISLALTQIHSRSWSPLTFRSRAWKNLFVDRSTTWGKTVDRSEKNG